MVNYQFEFKKYITSALNDLKFKELMEIQKEILRENKSDRNIIAMSKTGSGKTHAFLIPIFNDLDALDQTCQAVIVAPTNELATQIYKKASHLASFSGEAIKIKCFTATSDIKREVEKLKVNHPQIVIATPNKIKELSISFNQLKIHDAKYFVIDEADMVADSFLEEILEIQDKFKNAKKMLFSATISEQIEPVIKKFIPNTVKIQIDKKDVSSLKITHYLIPIRNREKDVILDNMMKIINPYLAIIFANKKETVEQLYQTIKSKGYNCTTIHGNMSPRERKRVMNEIASLKYQYIIASDMVARGIDIEGVSHIINYELPRDFEFYIHRSGRTGRMYFDGICYSLYDSMNNTYLNNLENRGVTFEYVDIKHGEFAPYKGRNVRQNRIAPVKKEIITAKKMIAKPKKVTPGYKKKMNEEANKIAKKIQKNEGKKRR
ncbi:MAG: DEAD/DEAH box helicase [bacterium]